MNKDCAIDHVKEKEEEEDSDDEETDDEEFMSYLTEMFVRLLGELKDSNKNEQKQIIEEVNGILDEMERKELESVLSDELSNKIHKMIKEKKLSMENAILLLKHIGYLKTLKRINIYDFEKISLGERIDKMNAEEEEKKEEKNKKLLADLCECYLLLTYRPSYEFISASCILCILKVASRKDETEEVQKDVEIALLALRYISQYFKVPEELYLNEIREIIKYHQKHHNLTSLAYQSAWQFLVNRMVYDNSPVEVIANELHFAREAISELEELTKCIDWKKNGDQMKEMEEENLLEKWITTLNIYFRGCEIRKKEHVVLIESIIQMLRAAKDYCSGISEKCIELLITVSYNTSVEIEDLLKCGAVCMALGEINRLDFMKTSVEDYLQFFENICERLKKVNKKENEETKRKETKRKVFDRLEEEGYEDCIIGFSCCIVDEEYRNIFFVQRIEDYFVHC